jgi:hypothetical protein
MRVHGGRGPRICRQARRQVGELVYWHSGNGKG